MTGFSLFPLQGALAALTGTNVSSHANLTLPNVLPLGHDRPVSVSSRTGNTALILETWYIVRWINKHYTDVSRFLASNLT